MGFHMNPMRGAAPLLFDSEPILRVGVCDWRVGACVRGTLIADIYEQNKARAHTQANLQMNCYTREW